MWGKKTFLLAAIVLTLNSVTNADLVLTLNGLDAAKESIEIEGKDNIVIAVAGSTEVEPNTYYIKATGGTLETTVGPNAEYSFTFEDGQGLGVVSLTANNDTIIEGVPVGEGDTICELVLFYIQETDTIVAFGTKPEASSYVSSEPSEQDISEADIIQPEPEAIALSTQDTAASEEDVSAADEAEDFNQPLSNYWQNEQEKRQKHLIHCPADSNSNIKTFRRAAYEAGVKERSQDRGSIAGELLAEGNVIEINSNITTNQIWTANNIYYVTTEISVQALLVIEPGTIICFKSYCDDCEYPISGAMYINQGGTLISCGTPDNPIVYTSDNGYYGYGADYDYFCPIYITGTASTCTKVTYSYIEFAGVAIITDNIRLDTPLENNCLFHNYFGIGENGTHHTDIMNNLIFDTNYYGNSIQIFMPSNSGEADANSHILIQNNTCDSQACGIVVSGAPDLNDAGLVMLINNIVSESYYCGLYFDGDYYVYGVVSNTGYYGNLYFYGNNNFVDFPEDNPVEVNDCPYVVGGPGELDICYLDQNCPFIDAGLEYIDQTPLVGKTTDANSFPDSDITDLGFHYPNWCYSNAGDENMLSADLNRDLIVNFKDFAIFTSYWQQSTSGEADLDDSGFVDYNDLYILAGQWLQVAEPNIQIHIYGDSNDGYVEVGVTGFTPDTQQVFLLADGERVGEIFGFQEGDTLGMDISESGGQQRQLKAISVNSSCHITCSNITNTVFSCPLNYCLLPRGYKPNKPLYFSAFNPFAGDVSVKVYADCGNLVWSQTYSGNTVKGSIPAQITSQHEIDYVSFDKSEASITKISDPVEPDLSCDAQALIILPAWDIRWKDSRSVTPQVQAAFKNKGIKYKKLVGGSANYDTIAFYAATNPIKYIYVLAHGNYRLVENGVLRTVIELYDGPVVSIKQSDPGGVPSWCTSLGDYWEPRVKSFFAMGFNSLEFAQFFCCYSGRLKIDSQGQLVEGQPGQSGTFDGSQSDMSIALGMGEPSRSRYYQGWFNKADVRFLPETEYQEFSRIEWEELGNGNNLYWALYEAIWHAGIDAVYNYRLKGQGSLMDIELRNW
jgi:hypothetical protein